jgi:hypothetical protein
MQSVQIYKPSTIAGVIYGAGLFIMLAAAGLLLYAVFSGNFTIDETGKPLILKGLFFLVVLVLLFGFMFFKHRGKPKFYLYETGVQIGNGNIIPFETIQDVYLFLSGKHIGNGYNNLAFRTSENDEWHIISADYSGKLDVFLDKYFAPRVRFMENELQKGNAVQFLCLTKKNINAFGTGAKSFVKNLQTETIRLGVNSISIGLQSPNYANLLPLYMNGEYFEIKTQDNSVIAKFRYVDMMSFDVFREIYNRKTKK